MVDFRVSVVLPAAGIGSRMCSNIPKQYLKILSKPLISYTIEAFERIPWIETIVVVGPAAEHEKQILENIVLEYDYGKVVTICGGPTRHGSIYNGVRCLNNSERKPDVVLIHDAVRPFIEESLLKKIVVAAKKHGACGVIRPLVSTVLARSTSGFLDYSLDRSKFVASEMPQAFVYNVILNAYGQCTQDDFDFGTECLHLASKYSDVRAFLIDGPDYLWKVTYKKDIFAAEGIIKERLRRHVGFSGNANNKVLEEVVKEQFKIKGVEIKDHGKTELCKVNVLVNFSLLQDFSTSAADDVRENIINDLQRIEENGILLIIQGGCEEKLSDLRKTTDHVSRKSIEKRLTCCGIWCENFVSSMPLQKMPHEKLVLFSKMIVNVALETSQNFNGQVFTVLDRE